MITERLKAALDSASSLPPEQQDEIAAQVEEAIENAVWDAELRDPRNQGVIAEMATRALEQPARPMPALADFGLKDDSDDDSGATDQASGT